jgi:hypothetical protein
LRDEDFVNFHKMTAADKAATGISA